MTDPYDDIEDMSTEELAIALEAGDWDDQYANAWQDSAGIDPDWDAIEALEWGGVDYGDYARVEPADALDPWEVVRDA